MAEAEVFEYMGEGGPVVPSDVVRVRVHPSVTIIPERAFTHHKKLEVVELCDGLLEIGEKAFYKCKALKSITIPSTVTVIQRHTFQGCSRLGKVELREGLREIGDYAFYRCKVLRDINLPSTLKRINDIAFEGCCQLTAVNLCEGLQHIGEEAFTNCHSLEHDVSIPLNVTEIGPHTFSDTSCRSIRLHDGIERIGHEAFALSKIPNFRIPPLMIQYIDGGILGECPSLFSIEIPDNAQLIDGGFQCCPTLRNVAIPSDAIITSTSAMHSCWDLQRVFDPKFENPRFDKNLKQIINSLKQRFDNLPIHKMIYYHSYNDNTLDQLNAAADIKISQWRRKLNPTGKQQDCLGMTPLHILACSTVQNIELYKVLVAKYPENLITKDRWEGLPLLYAVWANAPEEVLQFLVESYKSNYPNYEFNWTEMIWTLATADAPKSSLQNLVLQQESFSDQILDWSTIISSCLDDNRKGPGPFERSFRNLVQCSLSKRIDAIGIKQWRDDIMQVKGPIGTGNKYFSIFITDIEAKVASYEVEYHKLKEATSLLELALWKHNMNKHCEGRRTKRVKIEESHLREQCRVSCAADVIIEHVLPYLLPDDVLDDMSSTPLWGEEDDSESDSDNENAGANDVIIYDIDDDLLA